MSRVKCKEGCRCGKHTKPVNKITKVCESCSESFEVFPHGKSRRFCSRECAECGHSESMQGRQLARIDGRTEHVLYPLWYNMMSRCTNPLSTGWRHYGGRGISVYQEWVEDPWSFYNYCDETLGIRPDGYSIDRIDNDGNYEPGNIRWATQKQQVANRRSSRV